VILLLDRNALIDDIRALMQAPLDGSLAPNLEAIERTLTDGYAHALALEAERLQLERRLGRVADEFGADPQGLVEEIVQLSRALKDTDLDLAELRSLLGSLRSRADAVRAA